MELPLDVEIEILLRLPVQPLRRLELVSKQWRSLIRCRSFMERHLADQKSKHRFTILANVMVRDQFASKISRETGLFRNFCSSDGDPGFSYVRLLQNNDGGAPSLSCDGFICCPRPGNKFLFINRATPQIIAIQAEQQPLCHRPLTFESRVTLPFDRVHLLYHKSRT
ncbi:hypothetical protein CARUB_v10006198mg [Capsella rubella]|uniref:F-box domain-containing protein n=1 Tax=Capsella rubella TaxID=81985 RepID=R0GWZ5_9BRAS|nr:hypothetical protein CARUB_v10006198mg [Capsella rubella]